MPVAYLNTPLLFSSFVPGGALYLPAGTPVASLSLVSPGAVTDGVTTLLPQKLMTFLVIVTTRILSAFPDDHLFSVLVNSPANIGVARGAMDAPAPPGRRKIISRVIY